MPATHPPASHGADRAGLIAVLFVVMLLTGILLFAERGGLRRFADGGGANGAILPDTTLDNDPNGHVPVVTSVRSGGETARAGLQAGDDIEAIDGRAVRSVADMRAAISATRATTAAKAPLALLVLRGNTSRTILLGGDGPASAKGPMNGAENPAD